MSEYVQEPAERYKHGDILYMRDPSGIAYRLVCLAHDGSWWGKRRLTQRGTIDKRFTGWAGRFPTGWTIERRLHNIPRYCRRCFPDEEMVNEP